MIGRSGKRGSGISMRAARHDDDDEDWFLSEENRKVAEFSLLNVSKSWETVFQQRTVEEI